MNRRRALLLPTLALPSLFQTGCNSGQSGAWREAGAAILGGMTNSEGQAIDIAAGLREALRVGTQSVVQNVGRTDGFNADRNIRIPLPRRLNAMRTQLQRFGLGQNLGDLEVRLNRAAEAAAPEAKQIFWNAIRGMTLRDAQAIFNGPNDAATQYFKQRMSGTLVDRMSPVISNSLAKVGAIQAYDRAVERYRTIPGASLAPDLKTELANHTVNGALFGLFHYLAQEEAAIRQNPAKRTTEILRQVFGSR